MKPLPALAGLALSFVVVKLGFALVTALCVLALSLPRGVLFGLPTLSAVSPSIVLTLAIFFVSRLSYRLLDRSGVFPDAQSA